MLASFHPSPVQLVLILSSSLYLGLFSSLSDAKENFDMAELARVRGEECNVTTVRSTYGFAWKVTATPGPTKSETAGTKEHGIIMDALHHTMMDYEYRQMWMSLMRHDYSLFMKELNEKGHTVFIKPKYKKHDDTFEGEKGKRRWKFLLQYFEKMSFTDFERILSLFDYERQQCERHETTTFASPPLPSGYWERTHPTFDWGKLASTTPTKRPRTSMNWKLFGTTDLDQKDLTTNLNMDNIHDFEENFDWKQWTTDDNDTNFDPWKFTLPDAMFTNLHKINPRLFTTPDK
uniref:Uncharacterized protein n=1 Tax=Cacopsylla melanoneura TaxID=428564 RepID=A0A8D8QFA5_9HEMI